MQGIVAMFNKRQLIVISIEVFIVFILLFIAIPGVIKSINTRVSKNAASVTISNKEYLKSIDKNLITQVESSIAQLATETPGYAAGTYTASSLTNISSGFSFNVTPAGSTNQIKVYVEVTGLNNSVVFVDGKLKGPDYIPDLYKIGKEKAAQEASDPTTVSGYKIYPSNRQDEIIVPVGDKPSR